MFDVAIVGCGPVGALAANLLGGHGLSTVVLEREAAPYPLPRAVHIDHEVMRVLQSVGLADVAAAMMRATQGHLHIGADGEILRYLGTAGQTPKFGWANDLFFYQPELEATLRAGLDRFPGVELRLGAGVSGISQTAESVTLDIRSERIEARYVIACDGAASSVRKALGIDLVDLDFEEPWLVVDAEVDGPVTFPRYRDLPPGADLQQLSVMLCDPARPATVVPGRGNHRRWEFMLLRGEDDEAMRAPEIVAGLLAPWVADTPHRVVRAATYRFHGLLAERWQSGRVFLAGDAAHQTPPFFGQGMCHGVRDVANLAWKLALVLRGAAPAALLNGYQAEREPQVRSVIAAAVATGRYICERDPAAAAARDAMIRAREAAGGPRTAADLIVPIGGLVRADDAGAGERFVQPFVSDASGMRLLLDDATGGGARLLLRGDITLPAQLLADFAALGGSVHQIDSPDLIDIDGGLAAWLDAHWADAVLVRPDFYVFGTASSSGAGALVSDWLRDISA